MLHEQDLLILTGRENNKNLLKRTGHVCKKRGISNCKVQTLTGIILRITAIFKK